MAPEVVSAALENWQTATIGERLRAAFRLLEVLTLRPHEIDSSLISELENSELNHLEMEEIASVAFQFNFINRVADAVNFPMPDTGQKTRQAKLLNLFARVVTGGKRPSPSWMIGSDGLVRPAELNLAREQLLAYSGTIDAKLRTSIEAAAASLWRANRPQYELPGVVHEYVKPLALHAYRIMDELVASLVAAGYTQQQLFEITLIGAFGAALAGPEYLFQALYGSRHDASEPTAGLD